MLRIISILLLFVSYNNLAFCEFLSNDSLPLISNRFKRADECRDTINSGGLIIGGNHFHKGKFPWMVALISTKENEYFCGGVLVSNDKVLTAAHCIYNKNDEKRKQPSDVLAFLGVHNLENPNEPDRIVKESHQIFIHPDWNPYVKSYNGDLAAISFKIKIRFTAAIKPICLWRSDDEPKENKGYVIGYGKSEDEKKNYETKPKQLDITIIPNVRCFLNDPDITRISSEKTLCGDSDDDSGPCFGDSGHGLFIYYGNVFYLRGLVSSTLLDGFNQCDTRKYTVFTDVLKYKRWIDNPSDGYGNSPTTHQPITSKQPIVKELSTFSRPPYEDLFTDSKLMSIVEQLSTTRSTIEELSTTQSTTETYIVIEKFEDFERIESTTFESTTEKSTTMEPKTTTTELKTTTTEPKTTTTTEPKTTTTEPKTTTTPPQTTTTSAKKSTTTRKIIQSHKELEYKFQYDDSFCGLMSQSNGLVQGGKISTQRQFPWIAIIKKKVDDTWVNYGSGSLVSYKHVVVDSTLVSNTNKNDIKVHLGATKSDNLYEANTMEIGVLKILSSSSDNIISILTLNGNIVYTQFIRPVCLWPFGDDLSDIIGRDAYAVGYGVDHTGRDSLIRKHVRMIVIDEDEDCQDAFEDELSLKDKKKLFCVKSDKNEGPCVNDAQLFVKNNNNWYLKALASRVYIFENGTCDTQKPVLYEDIAQFVPWIIDNTK